MASHKAQKRKIGLLVACLACVAAAQVPQNAVDAVADDVALAESDEPQQHQQRAQVVFDAFRDREFVSEDAPKPAVAVQAPIPHATAQDRAREGVFSSQ